jgi:hypothetical protein
MTKHIKILIGVIIVAVIILVVALVTTPKVDAPQVDVSAPATLSVIGPAGAAVEVGQRQDVQWLSDNYAAPTVTINIIRKIGDSPIRYELVRTVSSATLNDGLALWIPTLMEAGDDIYVEVGCTLSSQACTASQSITSLAVIDSGRYSNTASVFEALEAKENN